MAPEVTVSTVGKQPAPPVSNVVVPPAPVAKPGIFARAHSWLESIDRDGNGVPTYRDGEELRRAARVAYWLLSLAARFLPGKAGKGANQVKGKVDQVADVLDGFPK